MGKFFLRLPTEDRYFEIVTGVGSPEEVTITEVFIPPTAVLEYSTPVAVPSTEAPYTKTLANYTDLVTSQYQNSPKFLEWLSTSLQMLTYQDDFVNTMQTLFDIDDTMVEYANQLGEILIESGGAILEEDGQYTLIGDHPNPILDIIGAILNCPRKLTFQPSNGVSPILDDTTYAILLRATIGKNNWGGNMDSLQPLWKSLFLGGTINVVDNQDMTMTVSLKGGFTSIIEDLINNGYIVPRPQGVWITGFGLPTVPLWGWGYNNEYIGGWGFGTY